MQGSVRSRLAVLAALLALLGLMTTAGLPSSAQQPPAKKPPKASVGGGTVPLSVDAARERARLLHRVYASTLDVIHHRYFRHDRATVPARALEDVFAEMARQDGIRAKWIVVNAKEMSIDHKPKTDFDHQAVKAIAAGKGEYEQVSNGWYRRAGAISLMNKGCLGCHLQFGSSAKKERFAGLVIEIPVRDEK